MKNWFKAKFEAEKQRLSEAHLTNEEKALFNRFNSCKEYIPMVFYSKMIAVPKQENFRNRGDIRKSITQDGFLEALETAETEKKLALEKAEQIEREKQAQREEQQRLEREARSKARAELFAKIDAFHDNELNVVEVGFARAMETMSSSEYKQLRLQFHDELLGTKAFSEGNAAASLIDAATITTYGNKLGTGLRESVIRRTLRDFPDGHRAILRLADIMYAMEALSESAHYSVRLSLAWNDGKSQMTVPDAVSKPKERVSFNHAVRTLMETKYGSAEAAAELVQGKCRAVLEAEGLADEKAALNRYLYSGTRWLTSDGIKPLIPNGPTEKALRLGSFTDGEELLYDRAESLITIAPPGTGKSTSHVLRNLLYLQGPAVVLDIKGDMYAATSAWRRQNVGAVYKFAPNDSENSIHFNPLDFISTDQDAAYEESERLAELLTVPAEKGEYFDDRAIQVIRAIVLYVALTREGSERSMETVIDLLSGVNTDPLAKEREGQPGAEDAPFDALISDLMMHDMPTLRRLGNALNKMPDKQREGVFDTARSKLKVWESPAIARLTKTTTFSPQLLRQERATLYLCIDLSDIKRFASVLRVLLGSCIGTLCRGTPDPAAETVTFFLDEMPRLKRMDVIEEALDVGRGFGVRLWLFAQNVGQLESSYANAEGMIGNCLAQCYMNPETERAAWLSRHLGRRRGLLDGSERALVEASDLTGLEFADKVVIMLNGMDNAVVSKRPYYKDPEALKRATEPSKAAVEA